MKTDRLCMLGIDALDERGDRLDGFHLVNKAPVSVGTDGWRLARQVFRPRRPIESLTLMLCARGANGHTLDATGLQPQNNVVGTVWWDDVRVHEPESLPEELRERGVATVLRAGHDPEAREPLSALLGEALQAATLSEEEAHQVSLADVVVRRRRVPDGGLLHDRVAREPGGGRARRAGCYTAGKRAPGGIRGRDAMSVVRRWKSADLEVLPDEGKRYEIIDGELYVSKQPHWHHQYVCGNVLDLLRRWGAGRGQVNQAPGLIFAEDDEVAPDVVWVSTQRLATVLWPDGKLHAAPDLIVEVLSLGAANERRDREVKLTLYSRRGVQEYWIVDWQDRRVEVFRRQDAGLTLAATLFERDHLESPLFPGCRVAVAALFEGLPTLPS